jgi:hypothetical protein
MFNDESENEKVVFHSLFSCEILLQSFVRRKANNEMKIAFIIDVKRNHTKTEYKRKLQDQFTCVKHKLTDQENQIYLPKG